jgi:hypothetical protein
MKHYLFVSHGITLHSHAVIPNNIKNTPVTTNTPLIYIAYLLVKNMPMVNEIKKIKNPKAVI